MWGTKHHIPLENPMQKFRRIGSGKKNDSAKKKNMVFDNLVKRTRPEK